MKRLFLLVLFLALSLPALSQHTELGVALNSGLFSFSGPGAVKETYINDAPGWYSYTNDPYGSLPGPIFGLTFNLKKITPYRLVFGFSLAYDFLRSTSRISGLSRDGQMLAAKGHSHLNQDFINLFPQIGYRFQVGSCSFDALVGFDLAYGFRLYERGHAIAEGKNYRTKVSQNTTMDFRPRAQVAVSFNRITGFLSYAAGLIPYDFGEMGIANPGVFAHVWRLGIGYRLK